MNIFVEKIIRNDRNLPFILLQICTQIEQKVQNDYRYAIHRKYDGDMLQFISND